MYRIARCLWMLYLRYVYFWLFIYQIMSGWYHYVLKKKGNDTHVTIILWWAACQKDDLHWWSRFYETFTLVVQRSWNLFSTVSHLDQLPFEVCQSREISISPEKYNINFKFLWIHVVGDFLHNSLLLTDHLI